MKYSIYQLSLEQSLPLSLPLSIPLSLPLSHQPITCHYIQPATDQPVQLVIINDTQWDPLTWIIYQGDLSIIFPTSLKHVSTMHVPISPTYHQVPTYTMHQPCINMCHNLYHKPCTITSASTIHQTCIINTYIVPCVNHAHQPSTPVPYHAQPCTSTIHKTSTNMPISPRCASRTMPTSSVQHAPQSCVKTRTKIFLNKYYTNINNAFIQSCTSIHVPQPYTISLMICLNHAIHHNIINM